MNQMGKFSTMNQSEWVILKVSHIKTATSLLGRSNTQFQRLGNPRSSLDRPGPFNHDPYTTSTGTWRHLVAKRRVAITGLLFSFPFRLGRERTFFNFLIVFNFHLFKRNSQVILKETDLILILYFIRRQFLATSVQWQTFYHLTTYSFKNTTYSFKYFTLRTVSYGIFKIPGILAFTTTLKHNYVDT